MVLRVVAEEGALLIAHLPIAVQVVGVAVVDQGLLAVLAIPEILAIPAPRVRRKIVYLSQVDQIIL